jgi:hypothetical protein
MPRLLASPGIRSVLLVVAASAFASCGDGSPGTGGSTANGGGGSAGLGGVSGGGGTSAIGGGAGIAGTGGAGGSVGTGGTQGSGGAGTGGAAGTGGTQGTGGAAGRGGAVGTGGAQGTSDAGSGTGGRNNAVDAGREAGSDASARDAGGGLVADGSVNPSEAQRVSAWLNNALATGALPNYAYTNIRTNFGTPALFNKLVTAVVNACAAFAPTAFGAVDCEALLVSAMVAESSYNPNSVVFDTYSNGTDPTVGLLQVRFSSTVHDYNFYGPLATMANIGCPWPTNFPTSTAASAWTNPGASGTAFMEDPACNVGLAAWYYLYNATCNGGASGSPVYIAQCCLGQGMAGTIEIGLLSHLRGPDPANPPGALDPYVQGIECCAGGSPTDTPCTGCTGRFAAMVGGLPTPDPFRISLVPETSRYCR